ncbi:hypothetical protein ECTW07945_2840, partial [Escherichia coli TW07945]
MPEADSL